MQWLTYWGLLIGAGSGLKDNVIIEELMLISDGHSVLVTHSHLQLTDEVGEHGTGA